MLFEEEGRTTQRENLLPVFIRTFKRIAAILTLVAAFRGASGNTGR